MWSLDKQHPLHLVAYKYVDSQAPPQWRLGEAGDKVRSCSQGISQSCLCKQNPNRKFGHQSSAELSSQTDDVLGGDAPWLAQAEGTEALCLGPCQTLPYIWLVLMCIFYKKNCKHKYCTYLSSVSCSRKLSNLRDTGVTELNLQWASSLTLGWSWNCGDEEGNLTPKPPNGGQGGWPHLGKDRGILVTSGSGTVELEELDEETLVVSKFCKCEHDDTVSTVSDLSSSTQQRSPQ